MSGSSSITPVVAWLVAAVSWVGALWTLPISTYLGLLTLCAWRKRPPAPGDPLHLVCVVPAHDEQEGIAATVHSLLEARYPVSRRSVLVVADNCTDATAAAARAAGARVVERTDAQHRGKGYALEFGFARALDDESVEGVLVVDADTVVSPELWWTVAAHLARGAAAVQVANVVRNPRAGWRAGLQAIGMALINGVRSLGRERLGLSAGLRGTGMAFARSTLEQVPHRAHGVVEDIEYGVALGLLGRRVVYAPEAWIASDAPVTAAAALSQRRRWEGGRRALGRALGPRVARAAVATRSALLADLVLDLVIPPLSWCAIVLAFGGVLEMVHLALVRTMSLAAPVWLAAAVVLALHVARGLTLSGTGWRGLAVLATAPAYVGWKLVVARPWRPAEAWVRTHRPAHARATSDDAVARAGRA